MQFCCHTKIKSTRSFQFFSCKSFLLQSPDVAIPFKQSEVDDGQINQRVELMNCLCGMVDRRKAFSLISSRDHCQRSLPLRISDTPQAGFQPAQNLSLGFFEWSCTAVITTTPRRHIVNVIDIFQNNNKSKKVRLIHKDYFHLPCPIYSFFY